MKFKQLTKEFLIYKKNFVKESSAAAYWLLTENHIIPYFGKMDTDKITENMVQTFVLEKISSGLSVKTVKDVMIVIKMIFKYGKKIGVKVGGFEKFEIDYPSDNSFLKEKLQTYSKEEIKIIRQHIIENFSFRNLGILIAVSTGVRIGELCGLQWKDIDLENGNVTVSKTVQRIYFNDNGKNRTKIVITAPKTKTGHRVIPLSKELLLIIKPLMKVVKKDNYILSNSIKPDEARTYRCFYEKFLKEIGLHYIKFHGLRHTFATLCITSGIDVKTVSVMLGHHDVSTTLDLYSHPSFANKKAAINKIFN